MSTCSAFGFCFVSFLVLRLQFPQVSVELKIVLFFLFLGGLGLVLSVGADFNTRKDIWRQAQGETRKRLNTGRTSPKATFRLYSGVQPTPGKPPPADLAHPGSSAVFTAVLLSDSCCCCRVHGTDPIDLSHQVPTETCSEPPATKYRCLSPNESRPNTVRLPADVSQPFRSGRDPSHSNHDGSRSPLADGLLR